MISILLNFHSVNENSENENHIFIERSRIIISVTRWLKNHKGKGDVEIFISWKR
jgi:hypothetical protein